MRCWNWTDLSEFNNDRMVYNFPLYISSIHKHNINLVNKDHNFMWDYYHTSLNNTIQSVSIGEVQIPQPHYQIIKLGLQSWWNSNKTKLEITKAVSTIQKLDNQSKKYKILPIYKQFFFFFILSNHYLTLGKSHPKFEITRRTNKMNSKLK